MEEDDIVTFIKSHTPNAPADWLPPFKVLVRPSSGQSRCDNFAFLSWVHERHAIWFVKFGSFFWPNNKYALVRICRPTLLVRAFTYMFFVLLLLLFICSCPVFVFLITCHIVLASEV